jgi:phosphoadenosine phosphosulfate reductase
MRTAAQHSSNEVAIPIEWLSIALKRFGDQLEDRSPHEALRWGINTFWPDIVLATGFGPEGVVLMHQLLQLKPRVDIFYVDTDLLFPETYALRDELRARLNIEFIQVRTELSTEAQAEAHGPDLWQRDPDLCCHLRKVIPLRRFLASRRAWISGVRRGQTPQRAAAGIVEWDNVNQMVKLNPLANWTADQVWAYVRAHDLPTNHLHDLGYPSIGCWPCTKPVTPGENPRSGRWAGFNKTECGIHFQFPRD